MNTSVVSWDLTMLDLSLTTHKTWDDGGKHLICATGIPRVEQTDQRLRWRGLGQKMSKRVSIAEVPLNPVISLSLKQHFFYKKKNLVVGLIFFTNFLMLCIAIEDFRVIVDYCTV